MKVGAVITRKILLVDGFEALIAEVQGEKEYEKTLTVERIYRKGVELAGLRFNKAHARVLKELKIYSLGSSPYEVPFDSTFSIKNGLEVGEWGHPKVVDMKTARMELMNRAVREIHMLGHNLVKEYNKAQYEGWRQHSLLRARSLLKIAMAKDENELVAAIKGHAEYMSELGEELELVEEYLQDKLGIDDIHWDIFFKTEEDTRRK